MSRSTSLSEILKVLDTFIEREGHACVPRMHIERGIRLGDAVDHVRALKEAGALPAKAAATLQSRVGWYWTRGDSLHHVLITAVGEFVAHNGHAKFKKGSELAAAADSVRADFAEGRVDDSLFHALQSIPEWSWESSYDYGWNERYRELLAFVSVRGHARLPEVINGSSRLATWASWQRARYRAGDLPASRVRRLDMIAQWEWNPEMGVRQRYVEELKKYIEKHGHGLVANDYVTEDGYRLGTALSKIRHEYHCGRLPEHRKNLLNGVDGWTWDAPPTAQPLNEEALAAFRAYVDREGHGSVPGGHIEHGFRLGHYLTNTRARLKKGLMGKGQRKALDAIHLAWRRGVTAPDEEQITNMERAVA